jgi:hypothetical protein
MSMLLLLLGGQFYSSIASNQSLGKLVVRLIDRVNNLEKKAEK